LQRAIAPTGLLSSAAPEPTTADFVLALVRAFSDARGAPAFSAAFSALVSPFTAFFECEAALRLTPPCPEHAPRPDEIDVVPSLQTVAEACALTDPAEIVAIATAATVEQSHFRNEGTVSPWFLWDNAGKQSNGYAPREKVMRTPLTRRLQSRFALSVYRQNGSAAFVSLLT
jgi:hypothetical protein